MDIQVVSGADFPDDLTSYDLISSVADSGCMFNRKLLFRALRVQISVPITI